MTQENTNNKPYIEIIDDDYMVCPDCAQVIVNDCYDNLTDKQIETIHSATAELTEDNISVCYGDSEKDNEFSNRSCDHCNGLPGYRHHMVLVQHNG